MRQRFKRDICHQALRRFALPLNEDLVFVIGLAILVDRGDE